MHYQRTQRNYTQQGGGDVSADTKRKDKTHIIRAFEAVGCDFVGALDSLFFYHENHLYKIPTKMNEKELQRSIWLYMNNHNGAIYGSPLDIERNQTFDDADAKAISKALDALLQRGAIYCTIYYDTQTKRKSYLWHVDHNYNQLTIFEDGKRVKTI